MRGLSVESKQPREDFMPTLSGTVLLADGKPATNAVVELHNSGGDVVDQTQVDQRGRYGFHVCPESWRVVGWDAQGNRWRGAAQVADHAHLELLSQE
jgi:hypothetical protein